LWRRRMVSHLHLSINYELGYFIKLFKICFNFKNRKFHNCLTTTQGLIFPSPEQRFPCFNKLSRSDQFKCCSMDNFRRGLHSFFVTGPKMYQLYLTSFNAWAQ
jgi:hypothetical protein